MVKTKITKTDKSSKIKKSSKIDKTTKKYCLENVKVSELPQDEVEKFDISESDSESDNINESMEVDESGTKGNYDLDSNDESEIIESGSENEDDAKIEETNESIDDSQDKAKNYSKEMEEKNKRTVFVGNITSKCTKKVLLQLFQSKNACGPESVETVRIRGAIAEDGKTEKHAKKRAIIHKKFLNDNQILCAYVVLKKIDDIPKALKMNGHVVDGRTIRVDIIRGKKMSYEKNKCVFIGNIPIDTDEEKVRVVMQQFGNIVNVRLVRDKREAAGMVKGFGYVEYCEETSVQAALKMHNEVEIGGRKIRILPYQDDKTQKQQRKVKDQKVIQDKKKIKIVKPTNMKSMEFKEYVNNKKSKFLKNKSKKNKKKVVHGKNKTE